MIKAFAALAENLSSQHPHDNSQLPIPRDLMFDMNTSEQTKTLINLKQNKHFRNTCHIFL